jgi:hypothetical protein
MSTTQPTPFRRHRRTVAGTVAAVAVAGLLAACGSSSSTPTATASNAAATTPNASATGPQNVPPGLGKTVSGAAADKAKAAALAKYPGTVERVEQLSDGSYVVHVMRSSGGEVHVKVSKAYAVTGTETGPAGGAPRGGFGTPATGAAADKAKAAALAKYPGTVERVMQLPDGSYEVHVITKSGGEVHVQVSKAFAVTGTQQGGPPAGATPPAGNGTTTTQNS